MNKRWADNRNQERIRVIISFALTTFLLFGLSIMGTIRNGKTAQISGSQPAVQSADAADKAVVPSVFEETSTDEIILASEDKKFLNQIIERFEQGDLEGAARVLSDDKISWKEFPCMYDGTVIKAEVFSGHGLVFTKASTVFYGEFEAGKPQGNCTALRVLELEEGKRYDYAYGVWEKGRMNGEGECGYNYYDGVRSDITKVNVKKGVFKADLMQGEITYTSTNAAAETATWQFQVADGVIVADERWTKDMDSSGTVLYRLIANNDDIHAYSLSESAMSEDRWKNLIVYETLKVD